MSNKKSNYNWLKDKVKVIFQDSHDLKRISTQIPSVGAWSILKLISLAYFIPVYTRIIGTKKYFSEMFYVDLFAGSGLNEVKNENAFPVGSPFVAINSAKKYFDFLFFVDENEDNVSALKERLEWKEKQKGFTWLKDKYVVYNTTADLAVPKIINKMNKISNNAHSFWFIDPFKNSSLSFQSMKKICQKTRSDLLISVFRDENFRSIAAGHYSEKLTNWIGSTDWIQIKDKNDKYLFTEIYAKNISEITCNKPRIYYRILPINALEKNKKEPYYEMLFQTIKTKGDSKWLRAMDTVQEYLEQVTSQQIKDILRNNTSLDDFF